MLSACSGPGGQNGAGKPRNMVREGLGWVEHSHTESSKPAPAPIFNTTPGCVERMFRARRPKAAQPAPRKPKKALPGRFTPNCGERTISVGTSPRFGSRFRAFRHSVSRLDKIITVSRTLPSLVLFDAVWSAAFAWLQSVSKKVVTYLQQTYFDKVVVADLRKQMHVGEPVTAKCRPATLPDSGPASPERTPAAAPAPNRWKAFTLTGT